jgi:hypothetical protein
MALSQSALLEILDAIKEADVADRVRESAATIYQALIEAELTAVIGAEPHERTDARTAQRNGHRVTDPVDHRRGPGAADPQTTGRVVLSLAFWSGAAGSTKPCTRW